MATVSGIADSYDLEYLVGALFKVATNEAPFFSAIGGLTGGRSIQTKQFPWQTQNNVAPSQPANLEGADPTPTAQSRDQIFNVAQIHQEAIELTFTQQAAIAQIKASSVSVLGDQPVVSEAALQTMLKMEKIASDIDYSFFNGVFVDDTDINTARQTRGIFAAVDTFSSGANKVDAVDNTLTSVAVEADDEVFTKVGHGLSVGDEIQITAMTGGTGLSLNTSYWVITVPTADTFTVSATRGGSVVAVTVDGSAMTVVRHNPFTKAKFNSLLRKMFASGAKFRRPVIYAGAMQHQRISDVYGFAPESRTVGGVNIETIVTNQGVMGVSLVRNIPADRLAVVDLSVCKPAFLNIPPNPKTGRAGGHVLTHPLAQTGSTDTWEIYAEVGLEYGPPQWHGYIDGLTTDEATV